MKKIARYLLLPLVFLLSFQLSEGQNKRQQLEKKKQALQRQISQINALLTTNKKEKQSVVAKAQNLNSRIAATEKLIRTTNQEANLLAAEMNKNQNKITALRKELAALKKDYANLVQKSYRSRSAKSRLIFLFSSESFLQAYKRLQYMKQYGQYRKKQGDKIKKNTLELQQLNTKIDEQRKEQVKLLAENRATRKKLEDDKREQEALIAQISRKGSTYQQKIKGLQQEVARVDAQIKKIVQAAIAAENKKKGSTNTASFKLSPEAKALAANFAANKGKLPWPLKSGNITMPFGDHPSPLVKSVMIHTDAIHIQTNKNEPIYAIFKGKVIQIQSIPGANKAVFVQHGNYISLYNNLKTLKVHEGDQVSTGQELGTVGLSTSTHQPTLYFYIYKNTTALNPQNWILRR